MSDPDAPPLDEERIVEVLDRHKVDYVLVGGLGARLHGATKLTSDFDVCPSFDGENLARLAAALNDLGARLRHIPDDIALPPVSAQGLSRMELSPFRTTAGDLDVLCGIPARSMTDLARYETLRQQATPREVAGCTIYVASLEDIITSKETTNRAPDQEALPELRALRAAELAAVAYPGPIEDALAGGQAPSSAEPAEDTAHLGRDRQEPPGRSLQ